MMNKLFMKRVLNIFTDASVLHKPDGDYISCPGAIAVQTFNTNEGIQTNIIDIDYSVIDNTTNNRGELYGVFLGVLMAIKYKDQYDHINIFCDSQFAIFGLTKWIYDWYRNRVNGIYYNKSGNEVSNQDLFKKIVHTVISNNLRVNFYHQKGHCKNDAETSVNLFKRSNGILINNYEGLLLAYYNDEIDVFTGTKLHEHANKLRMPLIYNSNFDVEKYYLLTK